MTKLTIENTKTFLEKEGNYTIRLLNRNVAPPKQYIFALLWLNGNTSLWMVRFIGQNMRALFEESRKKFPEAKQILIEEIEGYLSRGYKITGYESGITYPPPWLARKR